MIGTVYLPMQGHSRTPKYQMRVVFSSKDTSAHLGTYSWLSSVKNSVIGTVYLPMQGHSRTPLYQMRVVFSSKDTSAHLGTYSWLTRVGRIV